MNVSNKNASIIFVCLILFSVVGVFSLSPIPQDNNYHQFSDAQSFFGVVNFSNVISNLPFLIVGILGLKMILFSNRFTLFHDYKLPYIIFFFGISMIAFGSGYYHLSPSNETLVWDRLPMTVAFMALFSIVLSEFLSFKLGKFLLWPLILVGISSVIYWRFTELNNVGDLRFYALVQFIPMLTIPVALLFLKSGFTTISGYWLLICCYALAKICEHYDEIIHQTLVVISGHSLKHLVAALGVYFLLRTFTARTPS